MRFLYMRYGVPYKGSKNKIAKEIVAFLPSAKYFVDLFAGGCAITHAASELTGGFMPKWEKVICNDINPEPLELFKNAAYGEFNKPEYNNWIGRNTFFAKKDTNPYIKYCWSFGNNGKSYLYSREIENWKKALHYAYVFSDYKKLEEIVGKLSGEAKCNIRLWIKQNQEYVLYKYINWIKITNVAKTENIKNIAKLEVLENLQRLQRLQRLQSLKISNIEFNTKDYRELYIPTDAIVYCDIPYENTNCGSYSGFNSKEFYNWAAMQNYPIYISSYNISDNRFKIVWEKEKMIQSSKSNRKGLERIYVQKAFTN